MTRDRLLFDTSALLIHFRQESGWQKVQELIQDDDTELYVASVSITEFARRLRDLGAEDDLVKSTVDNYRLLFDGVITIDAQVAMAGFLLGARTPGRLPLVDSLIAAAAQSSECALVHRDEHMSRIPPELLHQIGLAGA